MSAADPVICLAHGSRHPAADPAIARISDAVAGLTGAPACPAYLDFSPLTLTTVAATLAAAGRRRATVVPMLFTRAFHLRHDVPEALAAATAETGVEFTLSDGLGTGDDVAELLASRIPAGTGHYVLYSVGSTVAGANEAVSALARRVGELAGLSATHLTATGPGDTGPDALLAAIGSAPRPVHVAPLFSAPGTLWDLAVAAVTAVEDRPTVTLGVPLGTTLAPLIAERMSR